MVLTVTLLGVALVAALIIWLATRSMRRRGIKRPGTSDVVVRCAKDHLFTTMWVPGASFKSVRLGNKRYQHCPVGKHWSMVTPIPVDQLSNAERIEAARVHDIRIP